MVYSSINDVISVLNQEVIDIDKRLDCSEINLSKDNFTLEGFYKNNIAELDTTHPEYVLSSIPLVSVKDSKTIELKNWYEPTLMDSLVFCLYKSDGTPYNGTNARINYNDARVIDSGNTHFIFDVPEGVDKIGF